MSIKCFSAAVIGIDAFAVEIETGTCGQQNSSGREGFITIVGLPDAAVKESRDRIASAFLSSGFIPPRNFVVVNLAPAALRKEGAGFDLGIALGILGTMGVVQPERLKNFGVLGELALDGALRPVRGALPAADLLAGQQLEGIIVPSANGREAALTAAGRTPVYAVNSLKEAVELVNSGRGTPFTADLTQYLAQELPGQPDFSEVKGQALARRALEIAAAGGHNILMSGPPGTGKSLMAMRLATILPPLTIAEALETSRIYSVLGLLSSGEPILNRRPFRAPHHTISDAGLIGGGHDPRPGEVSLAHNGVLFLDELPEFKRSVLEVLRQPLESGEITVSRANGSCTFPANFMLCAAMNPCPCGRGEVELGCVCKPEEKRRYLKKISGPLLDRIDMQIEVKQLSPEELLHAPEGESSAAIRERVIAAREIQHRRLADGSGHCNADLTPRELRKFCALSPGAENLLRSAISKFHLSPRAYDRIIKVARTIADLTGHANIGETELFEAINYRKSPFL